MAHAKQLVVAPDAQGETPNLVLCKKGKSCKGTFRALLLME
jgi:hypothetical protein